MGCCTRKGERKVGERETDGDTGEAVGEAKGKRSLRTNERTKKRGSGAYVANEGKDEAR